MISKKICILFVCVLLFSACSASNGGSIPFFGGNSKQGSSDKPTNGLGLSYTFDVNTQRLPDVNYDLLLKNDGDKPIIITPENFKFHTINRYNGQDVFTQESLEDMRSTLFERGDILIPIGGEFKIQNRNLRIIDEVYFTDGRDSLYDSIDYQMIISYDYVTEFDNNLELDLDTYEVTARGISQAAPIKLTDINLINSNGDKLEFVIEDRGRGDSSVQINDLDFTLGTNQLNCKNYYKTTGSPKKIENTPILSNDFSTLLVVCDIDLSQYDDNSITTTKTFGSFSYLYTLLEQGTINFGDIRSAGYE